MKNNETFRSIALTNRPAHLDVERFLVAGHIRNTTPSLNSVRWPFELSAQSRSLLQALRCKSWWLVSW